MNLNARFKAYREAAHGVPDKVIPADIICEECEKRFVSFYCSQCVQMLCIRCEELCHKVDYEGLPHSHTLEKSIRPVRAGDVSTVVIPPPVFNLPETHITEEEYTALSNIDLTIPNTLANSKFSGTLTNFGPKIIKNEIKFCRSKESKNFLLNEYVVFFDPINRRLSFGRILR